MNNLIKNFFQIILIAVMVFGVVWFAFAQAGKDEGYRPTRDQILHICETVPQVEIEACFNAANKAGN